MKRYEYVYHEDFTGSIKGVNRFLKLGDILHPDDVKYFQIHYPNRIIHIPGTYDDEPNPPNLPPNLDPAIVGILNEQSNKIDALINIVKNGFVSPGYIRGNIESQPDSISMKEDSIVGLVNVNTSDIEVKGEVGESKKDGISVMDKISKLRKLKK